MHSPLRIKIQNAINKALKLENTDVLVVGGRRRNRKRKRRYGKDKRKSKKYEGKETPVLKAKTYEGGNGKYVALVADDGISLSPSMIDDLLDGTSFDCISINQGEDDEQHEETVCHNILVKEHENEKSETNINNEINLEEEIEHVIKSGSETDEERPRSCDTGYNSEEDHKNNIVTDDEDVENRENGACYEDITENTVNEDDVFMSENETTHLNETTLESGHEEETEIVHKTNFADVSLECQRDKDECLDNKRTEFLLNNIELETTYKGGEKDEILKEENSKADVTTLQKKFPVENLCTAEPRLTINFDYDNEEEEEIYTKQPKTWFKRKKEEDEEQKPLICCGDENGVGFACCTIL